MQKTFTEKLQIVQNMHEIRLACLQYKNVCSSMRLISQNPDRHK